MNQGTKFAIALVCIMIAMILMFVAFHPNTSGSVGELVGEFQKDLSGAETAATPPTGGTTP